MLLLPPVAGVLLAGVLAAPLLLVFAAKIFPPVLFEGFENMLPPPPPALPPKIFVPAGLL